jgi:hypothetical protein
MKHLFQLKRYVLLSFALLLLSVNATLQAQHLYGKASVGNSTLLNGKLAVQSTGELYIGQGALDLTGSYSGESGSKLYLSANADASGFFEISGTANGNSEIVPAVFAAWDGSRIDFIKAQKSGSQTSAFLMTDNVAELKHENQGSNMFWYIERTKPAPCLPLIVQLANHTLLVNNNAATNDGYKFVYYAWYKNGIPLKEGAHNDNGGSYYTGGANLDETAEYTVIATDSGGNRHLSCPYRFVRLALPINVSVYPNPVLRNAKATVQVETQDLSLLNSASVEIYDMLGQYIGKTDIGGQPLTSLALPAKTGIYLLKFRAKDYTKTVKIMVK